MGLDAFLDDVEGLMLGRSLGSGPWLFPFEHSTITLPQSTVARHVAMPQSLPNPITLRHEASLHITFPGQPLLLKYFVYNRKTLPSKVRLVIKIGKRHIMRTEYTSISMIGRGRPVPTSNFQRGTWIIACPPTIEKTLSLYPYVQVLLEEPGAGSPAKEKRGICDIDLLWPIRCLSCLVKWMFCIPCMILCKLGSFAARNVKRGASAGAAVLGVTRVIAESGKVDWKRSLLANSIVNSGTQDDDVEGASRGNMFHIPVKLFPKERVRHGFFLNKPTPEILSLKVKWEPPPLFHSTHYLSKNSTGAPAQSATTAISINHENNKDISYNPCHTKSLLRFEGLKNALHLLQETYWKDPIGPLSLSAFHPPPVKQVVAIYGINMPTEVSAVYRRNPCVQVSCSSVVSQQNPQPLFVLDKEASLDKQGLKTHVIEKGLVLETEKTPQTVITHDGSTVIRQISGDGTVPYWSLQQCRTWQGQGFAKCNVTVHEIDSAEHRAILNDARFHKILLGLLRCSE